MKANETNSRMEEKKYSLIKMENISKNLINELRNIDGSSKKVTFAKDYNVTMSDTTEITLGQEPIKRFWAIKVFFGTTGKRPFYYYFEKSKYPQYAKYVYEFEIKIKDIFDEAEEEAVRTEESRVSTCENCQDEITEEGCNCGKY